MSILIEDLKHDHIKLIESLEEIKTISSSSTKLKYKLSALKDELLEHFKKEDAELYPVLKKAAENDNNLKQTLDLFTQEMDEISRYALNFIKKYTKEDIDNNLYAKDFGRFLAYFGKRLRREEKILYHEYDKIKL